jgi:hypothetical protein
MKKTRYLDHIDLRVSDRKRTQVLWKAAASTRFFLRSLERTMGNLLCGWRRQAGCVLRLHGKTDVISPMARDSLFGLRPVKKWIGSPGSCARSAENAWKVRRPVALTAAAIMPAFLKIRTETN